MSNLDAAIMMAVKAHKDQKDLSGEPYILHPIRVMMKMRTEEEKIAAVLHDAVEDSDLSVGDLHKAGFSTDIIEAIKLLTRDDAIPYDDYIAGIESNKLAIKIKLADLEDNMNVLRLNAIDERAIKKLTKYFNNYKKLIKLL